MSPTDRPQPFDAIIIGSGQAGGPLSHRLADRDWKVALIEREHLGDSCVNYGCTPTKRMLASARVAHAARDGARYDVHAADIRVDMEKKDEDSDYQIMLHNLTSDGDKISTRDRLVPYAMFTEPELGRVGITEREARRRGLDIKVGKLPMSHVARAIEMQKTEGLMKIVVDAKTDRILGATILGVSGGEVVQTLMTLMMVDAPWTVFYQAMTIHPTITEGFFGLMNSVK